MVWGFAMILVFGWLALTFSREAESFWKNYLDGAVVFKFDEEWLKNIALTISIPLLLSLKSSVSNLAGMGMTNLQIVVKRVFTWIGLFGILLIFLQVELNVSSSNILIVAMSYFITEHLLGVKKKWLAELTFSGLLILVWVVLYFSPFY